MGETTEHEKTVTSVALGQAEGAALLHHLADDLPATL